MKRQDTREMKLAIAAGSKPKGGKGDLELSKETALWLLRRSIEFGHGRLAVVRLGMAVRVGAEVPPEHWHYCSGVADTSRDPNLLTVIAAVAREAQDWNTLLARP